MGNAIFKCVKCSNCFEIPDTKPDPDTLDIIAERMNMYLSEKNETDKTEYNCKVNVFKKNN